MIESLANFPENVVALICKGRVTKEDYELVVIPSVSRALKEHRKVRLYYETAGNFEGIEPSAMWADFKVGMAHFTAWERIAVVSDVDWIRNAVNIFGFMMPAEIRVFPLAGAAEAREWIAAANAA